jgi:hypothetical protein
MIARLQQMAADAGYFLSDQDAEVLAYELADNPGADPWAVAEELAESGAIAPELYADGDYDDEAADHEAWADDMHADVNRMADEYEVAYGRELTGAEFQSLSEAHERAVASGLDEVDWHGHDKSTRAGRRALLSERFADLTADSHIGPVQTDDAPAQTAREARIARLNQAMGDARGPQVTTQPETIDADDGAETYEE